MILQASVIDTMASKYHRFQILLPLVHMRWSSSFKVNDPTFFSRVNVLHKIHDQNFEFNSLNIQDLHTHMTHIFKSNDIVDANTSARYLLCYSAGIPYTFSSFQNHLNENLRSDQFIKLQSCISRRLNREPVQYIIGNWDFFGHTFQCRSPILIPRPETEELVEKVLLAHKDSLVNKNILDIGCGTGAIGISLLSNLLGKGTKCTAIDVHPVAVQLAAENARNILSDKSSMYTTVHSSFLEFSQQKDNLHRFDLIVSNPPYIPSPHLLDLQAEVRDFEDPAALDGGGDGLAMVREILRWSPPLLSAEGTREVWMEVHHSHPAILAREAEEAVRSGTGRDGSLELVDVEKDAFGQERFVRFRLKGSHN